MAGAAFAYASVDELFCRGRAFGGGNLRTSLGPQTECDAISGLAGVVILMGLVASCAGLIIWWRVLGRPVDPEGGRGWRWGGGVLAAVGLAVLAAVTPRYICPSGFELDNMFALCIHSASPGDRVAAADQLLQKILIAGGGVLLGIWLARAAFVPRSVAAVMTLVAWSAGMGWLLHETVGAALAPA